jgi:hypothetical protein
VALIEQLALPLLECHILPRSEIGAKSVGSKGVRKSLFRFQIQNRAEERAIISRDRKNLYLLQYIAACSRVVATNN